MEASNSDEQMDHDHVIVDEKLHFEAMDICENKGDHEILPVYCL